ncbi:hypothetical protein T12_13992 [Trichinella patagoniensis]|uniref:Uncharacterized protein n=1 Tax=Trichinella patagoniensis TaxID=990121 RepID=A0A0V1A0N1_9BILA|nr:hypothetical protein T12_11640 [Trichinella patagoniensis]KRY18322.1 hypothetical protein T12_13992 [Trichinella patagoniensis]
MHSVTLLQCFLAHGEQCECTGVCFLLLREGTVLFKDDLCFTIRKAFSFASCLLFLPTGRERVKIPILMASESCGGRIYQSTCVEKQKMGGCYIMNEWVRRCGERVHHFKWMVEGLASQYNTLIEQALQGCRAGIILLEFGGGSGRKMPPCEQMADREAGSITLRMGCGYKGAAGLPHKMGGGVLDRNLKHCEWGWMGVPALYQSECIVREVDRGMNFGWTGQPYTPLNALSEKWTADIQQLMRDGLGAVWNSTLNDWCNHWRWGTQHRIDGGGDIGGGLCQEWHTYEVAEIVVDGGVVDGVSTLIMRWKCAEQVYNNE